MRNGDYRLDVIQKLLYLTMSTPKYQISDTHYQISDLWMQMKIRKVRK